MAKRWRSIWKRARWVMLPIWLITPEWGRMPNPEINQGGDPAAWLTTFLHRKREAVLRYRTMTMTSAIFMCVAIFFVQPSINWIDWMASALTAVRIYLAVSTLIYASLAIWLKRWQ